MRRAAPVPEGHQRCNQCWEPRPLADFTSTRARRGGHPVVGNTCAWCRSRYRGWSKKTFDERLALQRKRLATGNGYRVGLTLRSGNRKTGPIPVSMTDRASCPSSCSFHDRGCYAEYHLLRRHWDDVGRKGMTWRSFCEEIARLPEGTLWRHNEAGDLPGKGDAIDVDALRQLVEANRGRRGFTFTHKPVRGWGRGPGYDNARAVTDANEAGFVVNLSADSLEDADALADLGIAYTPIAVVLPEDAPVRLRTPAGRRVVVCPAQTEALLTCADCQLCAQPRRKSIIGFRAHGQYKDLVTELVRSKRAA